MGRPRSGVGSRRATVLLESWAFSREAIDNGEVWRLAVASLAHLSWPHLYGNLAVFAAAVALLRSVSGPLELGAALLVSALATTLGLYFGSSLQWYVGASGALYGLLAWGALRLPMPTGPLLAGLLAINASIDQGRTLSWLGEPLAPQAHYWGLVGGLALAIFSAWRSSLLPAAASSPKSGGAPCNSAGGVPPAIAARISAT